MALIFLFSFQLILEVSGQFYSPYQQPSDFRNRKQSQNPQFADYFKPQTQSYQMGRTLNQNYYGQYQNPYGRSINSEKMQNSYRQVDSQKIRSEEHILYQRKLQANTTQNGICDANEYFDTETSWCTPCSSKFSDCHACNETACNTCMYSWTYLTPNGCPSCPDNCKTCDKNNCFECYDGLHINSHGDCTYCNIDNCKKCNSTSCLQCYEGLYVDSSNGQCSYCNWKFFMCDSCDESACNRCSSGFFLDSSNYCQVCTTPFCSSCNMTTCYACSLTHYLDANKCKQCSAINCLKCDNDICTSCVQSFYADSSGKCSRCLDHCLSCDKNRCFTCLDGFFVDSDGTCKQCSTKFSKYCNSCNNNTCTDCIQDFTPYFDGICAKCSDLFENCAQCDRYSCDYCDRTYYLDSNQNCTRCGSGCIDCIDSAACRNCIGNGFPFPDGTCNCNYLGTYMDLTTNTCEYCSLGCESCSNSASCTACWIPSMINNGDGTCSCPSGVYYGGSCSSCSYFGCASCEVLSYSKFNNLYNYPSIYCSSCIDGFYFLNNKCVPCSYGCAECKDSLYCLRCYDSDYMIKDDINKLCYCQLGYRFDRQYKNCVPCPAGCGRCEKFCPDCIDDSAQCYQCFDEPNIIRNWDQQTCSCVPTMVFNSTTLKCDPSTPHCAEYGSLACSKCEQGYFLHDNSGVLECLSCSESCNSCNPKPGCYQCGNSIEKDSATCADNSIGYMTRFDNGNLILDFAYDLQEPLSIKEIIIKSPGVYDTSSWYLTQVTSRQYMIVTNLKSSDLPIDVRFKFNRGY